MILDRLSQAIRYENLHPAFARAFAFLRGADLSGLASGSYELDGDRLFVIVERMDGRGRDGARLEAHRRYIDIQYTIAGSEEMGWKPLDRCSEVSQAYDDARDITFFKDRPDLWVAVPPGRFTIFFPSDAHAPLAGIGPLHKAIVKIEVESV